MIILGIDPGYAILGYGTVEAERGKIRVIDYGVVETPQQAVSVLPSPGTGQWAVRTEHPAAAGRWIFCMI